MLLLSNVIFFYTRALNFSRSEFNKYSPNHTGTTCIFVQRIFEELFLGLFDFTVNRR